MDLSIYGRDKDANATTYTNLTDQIKFGGKYQPKSGTTSAIVLQAFSRTPDTDNIDGIKYSKNSTIYFATTDSGTPENILGRPKYTDNVSGNSITDANKKTGAATGGSVTITGDATGFVSAYLDTTSSKLYAETLKLKSNNGLNYIDLSDYSSIDVESKYTIQTGSGTLWGLGSGYIKEWDKSADDFVKVYKVDGSFNKLSLNSKNNIIAWNQDDGVYSIIHNPTTTISTTATNTNTTSAAATATTTTVSTSVNTGWVKAANGTWSYIKTDGTKATSWINDKKNWYYLNTSGALQTGWINDYGTWYYADASGAILYNTTVDGYVLGTNGAWIG